MATARMGLLDVLAKGASEGATEWAPREASGGQTAGSASATATGSGAARPAWVPCQQPIPKLRDSAASPASMDLDSPDAMVQADITDIPAADGTFDFILCSHVLEHVPDDRRAIGDLFRVLKPGGRALIVVPIKREQTFEDPTVELPESGNVGRRRPSGWPRRGRSPSRA